MCMIDSSPYHSLWKIYLKRERKDKQDVLTQGTVSHDVFFYFLFSEVKSFGGSQRWPCPERSWTCLSVMVIKAVIENGSVFLWSPLDEGWSGPSGN